MKQLLAIALLSTLAMTASAASAATATLLRGSERTSVGAIRTIELANDRGMRVRLLTLGATVQSIVVPDRAGQKANVVLGYTKAADYLVGTSYFGATIGRYANRVAGARFTLDGRSYPLAKNDRNNSLHGGTTGFDKRIWTVERVTGGARARATLAYVSPDGEEGYPGRLRVTATFTLDESNALRIDYRATTDRATVVNMTNHSYFALGGEASGAGVADQRLSIAADAYLPIGETLVPSGERRRVAGTVFDLRQPRRVGNGLARRDDPQIALASGYDHSFVLRGPAGTTPRPAARLHDPRTGRTLEVLTTAPALQLYTGNFLAPVKIGRRHKNNDALCLEAHAFPNALNQPGFPSTRLDPGQQYRNTIIYRFATLQPRADR